MKDIMPLKEFLLHWEGCTSDEMEEIIEFAHKLEVEE